MEAEETVIMKKALCPRAEMGWRLLPPYWETAYRQEEMSGWPQHKFFPLAFKKCINLDPLNLANLIFQWPRSSLISSKTVLLTIPPAGSIFSEHLPRSTRPLTTSLCHCLSPGLLSPLDADNIRWCKPLADQLCLLWNSGQVIWTSCDSVTFLSNGDKKKMKPTVLCHCRD